MAVLALIRGKGGMVGDIGSGDQRFPVLLVRDDLPAGYQEFLPVILMTVNAILFRMTGVTLFDLLRCRFKRVDDPES
jgi:hypothetical protein